MSIKSGNVTTQVGGYLDYIQILICYRTFDNPPDIPVAPEPERLDPPIWVMTDSFYLGHQSLLLQYRQWYIEFVEYDILT